MRTTVIRHVLFEDLGLWASVLTAQGGAVKFLDAGVDDLRLCKPEDVDLLVILGGPIGVYDHAQYPFIHDELRIIRERIALNLPTMGICLGAQMIAAAMDANVYPSGSKEIGWSRVTLTSAGHQSCLAPLAEPGATVLHWHGDIFDLPAGATLLASTSQTPHQAFAVGTNILALQFHIEADPMRIDQWLIGHAAELAQAGIMPADLRRTMQQIPVSYGETSIRIFETWLQHLTGVAR